MRVLSPEHLGALAHAHTARRPVPPETALSQFDGDVLLHCLANARRIVCVTGAGISTSAGIADFRSKGGIYDQVQERFPELTRGQELFDANLFRFERTTSMFFTFVSILYDAVCKAEPTLAHTFMKWLDEHQRLLRVYTQNIDGLEAKVNLPSVDHNAKGDAQTGKVVLLHGTLHQLCCARCQRLRSFNTLDIDSFSGGTAPVCDDCSLHNQSRSFSGLRITSVGCLRPNVVLYNEVHPHGNEIASIAAKDVRSRPDLVLIMGTSLKVPGCCRLIKDLAISAHKANGLVLYLNRTETAQAHWSKIIDYHILGDVDSCVEQLKEIMNLHMPKRPKLSSYTKITSPVRGDNSNNNDLTIFIPPATTTTKDTPRTPRVRHIKRTFSDVEYSVVVDGDTIFIELTPPFRKLRKIQPLAFERTSLSIKKKSPPRQRKSATEKAKSDSTETLRVVRKRGHPRATKPTTAAKIPGRPRRAKQSPDKKSLRRGKQTKPSPSKQTSRPRSSKRPAKTATSSEK